MKFEEFKNKIQKSGYDIIAMNHYSLHKNVILSMLFYLRIIGIILSVLALIGGTARVFAGVHYPFDIIDSLFVATIAGLIIFYSKSRLIKINDIILSIYSRITNNTLSKIK